MAAKTKLESDIDSLFALPLADFTGARNTLAAELKKAGRADEAERVKALAKPSVSPWTVNQLYWKHRNAFEQLTASGERLRKAQTAQLSGKSTDTRGPLDERREAIERLSRLAATILSDAGHTATPETMRRITTTLEAISAYASGPDMPQPGRLTQDVDPPGFDALAALVLSGPLKRPETKAPPPKASQIAAAKEALRESEATLREAKAGAKKAEDVLKKAVAQLKEAEEEKKKAEEVFVQVSGAWEEASKKLTDAELAVKRRTAELQQLAQNR